MVVLAGAYTLSERKHLFTIAIVLVGLHIVYSHDSQVHHKG